MIPTIQNTVVLVNESARQGQGGAIWQKARAEVLASLPIGILEVRFNPPFDLQACLLDLIRKEVNCFISAGGDGSANFLLNGLMALKNNAVHPGDNNSDGPSFFVGGIGLGSSNDFLKPFGQKIAGIPLRINLSDARPADVGLAVFAAENGAIKRRFFIANASLGVTAAANYRFNHPDFLLKILKRNWTGAAILWTALRTISGWRNVPVQMVWKETEKNLMLSNLSVLKNPHVSGDFTYDQVIEQDDGCFGLNYCAGMNKIELLLTLADLAKGKFSGKPKRFSHKVKTIEVRSDILLPLETDGEVERSKNITFQLIPQAVYLLGRGYSLTPKQEHV